MPFLKGTPLEVHGGTLCLVGFVFHVEPQFDVAGDFGQHLLTFVWHLGVNVVTAILPLQGLLIPKTIIGGNHAT